MEEKTTELRFVKSFELVNFLSGSRVAFGIKGSIAIVQ